MIKTVQVDETLDCLSQLSSGNLKQKSRPDRFLKEQLRLHLKGTFVDFGVNNFSRDLKIKMTETD